MGTQFTDINMITSVAGYLANQLVASGWQVYWQATDVYSGAATQGTVTIVPEFPTEANLIVLPPHPRTATEVVVPAFSVQLSLEPQEMLRLGIGEDNFIERASIIIDGYCADKSQFLAFSTLFRNWFREDQRIPIYDWEGSVTTPALVDNDVFVQRRHITRLELPQMSKPVRYYINMEFDLEFSDSW